jgi:hypothetical protein
MFFYRAQLPAAIAERNHPRVNQPAKVAQAVPQGAVKFEAPRACAVWQVESYAKGVHI